MRQTFYFDGGCRPNPGPLELAVVCRGATYFRDDIGCGDNNQAEWLALIFAVDLALEQGITQALFIGDSTLVVQQARGAWPCRSAHLKPHLTAFMERARRLERFSLRHVPRSRNLAGIALERRHDPLNKAG